MSRFGNLAWECRDQQDQAEELYDQPLRTQAKRLESENLILKRLLRENGIRWPGQLQQQPLQPARSARGSARVTRSSIALNRSLPHLPVEVVLRILSYALTSPYPIIDPLSKTKPENLTAQEKSRGNQIAIHFLTSCQAYYVEGQRYLWGNNSFIFTSVQTLRQFANVDSIYRRQIRNVDLRIIARYYDDDDRVHKLEARYHPMLTGPVKLRITKRVKEPTLARRGFRVYALTQISDFLGALLPPHDPSYDQSRGEMRPRLFPNLDKMRIDLVNFSDSLVAGPSPSDMHFISSHHLGCYLTELIITGRPNGEVGYALMSELSGMLRDGGLLIDHQPAYVALKNNLRLLQGSHFHCKVVRGMPRSQPEAWDDDADHSHYSDMLLPVPDEEGEHPASPYHSCRTVWKRVPVRLGDPDEKRKWELYDRVSGLPWEDVEDVLCDWWMDVSDIGEEGPLCVNCGAEHPGAIVVPEDLYWDDDWPF